ncbi:heterodisulfide reductase-related iron-sulfur binding cluster [Paraliomyxa miuraensis]|uniref:heterodisulfide reductase-related iron-sulfur binding cluster n=1 Tax=Paraliomyxa miuraensis TaxID=376150 RepID=UPI0022505F84|nr:heterodisulfide reductase-related iron-sulfur binding cluster [Paraliomyxa miuraensis]MCX4247244.1 heterodisulfide reductase-related iron-sulfur binding cluster [Paraliomyxa miuraensis]
MADDDKNISYKPTDGLCYDPSEKKYWDEEALGKEITRVFEVCHGCRMCFKYCDSFPTLFSLLDEKYDGNVRKLTGDDTRAVMNACFQCKLCEVQCPYTPRDGHEFQLDFPKLVHRYAAIERRKRGTTLQDKLVGDPDFAGKAARMSGGMVNSMNRVRLHRWFMEKVLDVHRDKQLPDFASQTFESWAEAEGLTKQGPGGEVVLFQTCFVQHNEPQIGRDTVEVMKRNGVDLRCAKGLQCCGMPAWERGDLKGLRRKAHQSLDVLMPYVEAGAKVLAINPTCSMMLRREWPELLEGADRERATKLAAATMDPSEFLWSIRNEERFDTNFKSSPQGPVAYHAPCHLRTQGVGFKGRDLLRKLPGVKPQLVMECCGHDGTHAMTTHGFEPSQRVGKLAFEGMQKAEAKWWATDCPLAAIQFEQHAGRKPLHPMSLLARAYRGDSFEAPSAPASPYRRETEAPEEVEAEGHEEERSR